jgi:hypothetical protein
MFLRICRNLSVAMLAGLVLAPAALGRPAASSGTVYQAAQNRAWRNCSYYCLGIGSSSLYLVDAGAHAGQTQWETYTYVYQAPNPGSTSCTRYTIQDGFGPYTNYGSPPLWEVKYGATVC